MSTVDEIERRWLVTDVEDGLDTKPSCRISQGYLDIPGQVRVRVYHDTLGSTHRAEITRKTGKGIRRREENHEVSVGAAELLLGTTEYRIDKTRYIRDGWEVDFFHGKLEGLVLAEKELKSVDEPCPIPPWLSVGPEVTETLSNRQLAMTACYLNGPIDELVRKSSSIPRIVLTGGPCSGKSTLIEELRQGGEFHCVPELATVIMSQFGIMPDAGFNAFQGTLHRIQRSIEEGASKQASKGGKSAIILDRGTLDSAGFVPGGWPQLEEILGIRRDEEFHNYDVVVFIPVPSKEIYDANRHNNPIRRETWEQAMEAQRKLVEAWMDHPNFVFLTEERVPFNHRADVIRKLTDAESLQKHKHYAQVAARSLLLNASCKRCGVPRSQHHVCSSCVCCTCPPRCGTYEDPT